MRVLIVVLLALITAGVAEAQTKRERLQKMHSEMLDPVVRLQRGDGAASGTLVYSRIHPPCNGIVERLLKRCSDAPEAHTYAITNFHVVKPLLFEPPKTPMTAPDDGTPQRRLSKPLPVNVVVFVHGETIDKLEQKIVVGTVVAEDEGRDLALVRLDKRAGMIRRVAALAPKGTTPLRSDRSYSVGAALKLKPFMREGLFGGLYVPGDHPQVTHTTILTTAEVYYGDSGGALYHYSDERNRYELVGISVAFLSAEHLAFSVALSSVYEFLEQKGFGFIIPETPQPAR